MQHAKFAFLRCRLNPACSLRLAVDFMALDQFEGQVWRVPAEACHLLAQFGAVEIAKHIRIAMIAGNNLAPGATGSPPASIMGIKYSHRRADLGQVQRSRKPCETG